MDTDGLWRETRQLVTPDFWRDMAAAWLIVGAAVAVLFLR